MARGYVKAWAGVEEIVPRHHGPNGMVCLTCLKRENMHGLMGFVPSVKPCTMCIWLHGQLLVPVLNLNVKKTETL